MFSDSGRRAASSSTNVSLVYASAALGVIHNLATNEQTLFAGHDDDITCIGLSNNGLLAATGQTGKSPVVHIWRTTIGSSTKGASSSRKNADARMESTAAGKFCSYAYRHQDVHTDYTGH